MNNRTDFERAQVEHWHHIPVQSAPNGVRDIRWIAFYLTRAFGREKWSVHEVEAVAEVGVGADDESKGAHEQFDRRESCVGQQRHRCGGPFPAGREFRPRKFDSIARISTLAFRSRFMLNGKTF